MMTARSGAKLMTMTVALLLLSGCWRHSFPATNSFIFPKAREAPPAQVAEVFVDANGTFYPDGWKDRLGRPRSWRADSLLNESDDEPRFRDLIERDEARQLRDMAAFGRAKKRIFILVHGYNNEVSQAEPVYRTIEKRLDLRHDDGIVRFYWDGLTGTGIGGGKIWFNATGYSQLAGSRGLRRILEQFADRDIYLIGHSRGTSVILSALGNPVYDPKFAKDTEAVADRWRGDYGELLRPPPLTDRRNRIRVIVAAPAVDRIDFCDSRHQDKPKCPSLRDLGPQLVSFRYTVNGRDPVLNKFVGLSGGFNPTRLGLKAWLGRALKVEKYACMQPYEFEQSERFHPFARYVEHPTFEQMLADAGISREGAQERPVEPCSSAV